MDKMERAENENNMVKLLFIWTDDTNKLCSILANF